MSFKKLTSIAIALTIGILRIPPAAASTEVLVKVDCLTPTQGAGTCEVRLPNLPSTDIWEVTWPDGIKTKIRMPKNNNGIQNWNSESN